MHTPYAKLLKLLMDETGINEITLSRETKVPQSTISRILSGEIKEPKISKLFAIAKFFDINVSDFVNGELSEESASNLHDRYRENIQQQILTPNERRALDMLSNMSSTQLEQALKILETFEKK